MAGAGLDQAVSGAGGVVDQFAGWVAAECVAVDAVVSAVLQFPPAVFAADASSWSEIHAKIRILASCIISMA